MREAYHKKYPKPVKVPRVTKAQAKAKAEADAKAKAEADAKAKAEADAKAKAEADAKAKAKTPTPIARTPSPPPERVRYLTPAEEKGLTLSKEHLKRMNDARDKGIMMDEDLREDIEDTIKELEKKASTKPKTPPPAKAKTPPPAKAKTPPAKEGKIIVLSSYGMKEATIISEKELSNPKLKNELYKMMTDYKDNYKTEGVRTKLRNQIEKASGLEVADIFKSFNNPNNPKRKDFFQVDNWKKKYGKVVSQDYVNELDKKGKLYGNKYGGP